MFKVITGGTVAFHEKRKFYRIRADIPATIYPFFMEKDKEKKNNKGSVCYGISFIFKNK